MTSQQDADSLLRDKVITSFFLEPQFLRYCIIITSLISYIKLLLCAGSSKLEISWILHTRGLYIAGPSISKTIPKNKRTLLRRATDNG